MWLSIGVTVSGQPLAAQARVQVDTGVAVPMRDGVVLRADLWRPAKKRAVPGTGLPDPLRPKH